MKKNLPGRGLTEVQKHWYSSNLSSRRTSRTLGRDITNFHGMLCELLRGFHSAAANMTYSFDGGHVIRGRPAFTGDVGVELLTSRRHYCNRRNTLTSA